MMDEYVSSNNYALYKNVQVCGCNAQSEDKIWVLGLQKAVLV